MPQITIGLAILLDAIGLGGYLLTGREHLTALIPSIFGTLFLVLGILALKQSRLKHSMHAAAVLALVTVGGTFKGLLELPNLLNGGEVERPAAVLSKSLTAGLCLIFLGLCIQSFKAARKAREQTPQTQ